MSLRPSYTRFYASKWRSGTLMLSLEEEGLYIRVSAFQMECGQPLPDDWKEGARLLCVQPLKYRKTIDSLIAKGLIVSTPEGLICKRAMLEFRRASKSVVGEKKDPPTNPGTNPGTNRGTYPDTNRDSTGVEAKNEQQNQTQFDNRREEKEKNYQPDRTEKHAARADGPDEIPGLNGSTSLIVSTFAEWLNPWAPDLPAARRSIADAVGIYGDRAVRDAFAELKADVADGKLRVPTVKSFYGYCRTAKERGPRQAAHAKPVFSEAWLAAIAEREAVQ